MLNTKLHICDLCDFAIFFASRLAGGGGGGGGGVERRRDSNLEMSCLKSTGIAYPKVLKSEGAVRQRT